MTSAIKCPLKAESNIFPFVFHKTNYISNKILSIYVSINGEKIEKICLILGRVTWEISLFAKMYWKFYPGVYVDIFNGLTKMYPYIVHVNVQLKKNSEADKVIKIFRMIEMVSTKVVW